MKTSVAIVNTCNKKYADALRDLLNGWRPADDVPQAKYSKKPTARRDKDGQKIKKEV